MTSPQPPTNDFQSALLDGEIANLKSEMAPLRAPDAIEAALAKRFAKQHRSSGWLGEVGQWFAPGAAIAASIGVSAWLMLVPSVVGTFGGSQRESINDAALSSVYASTPFVALSSLEQIALEPNPRLVETELTKAMLGSMGVDVAPEVAGETIRAEMLVSASGQPLALRFTPNY
jgi:hypothetical protein